MLAVIDYAAGNIKSVTNAMEALRISYALATKPEDLKKADAVLVPGVGAAKSAMEKLNSLGLTEALRVFVQAGKPYLGICLGSQLLFDWSEEGEIECLKIFPGQVRKLTNAPKIPEVGWNSADFTENFSQNKTAQKLFAGIPSGTDFYYLHSYVAFPENGDIVAAETEYGQIFPAAVARDNVLGVQFHPERSGKWGLKLLENFGKLVAR
jgi:glutamine amidotransferase